MLGFICNIQKIIKWHRIINIILLGSRRHHFFYMKKCLSFLDWFLLFFGSGYFQDGTSFVYIYSFLLVFWQITVIELLEIFL